MCLKPAGGETNQRGGVTAERSRLTPHPADLHPVGCLLHLLSEGLGLCARLQRAGVAGRLGGLLIPGGGTQRQPRTDQLFTLVGWGGVGVGLNIDVAPTLSGQSPCPRPVWLSASSASGCWGCPPAEGIRGGVKRSARRSERSGWCVVSGNGLTSAITHRGSTTSLSIWNSNWMSSWASFSSVSPHSFSIFLPAATNRMPLNGTRKPILAARVCVCACDLPQERVVPQHRSPLDHALGQDGQR